MSAVGLALSARSASASNCTWIILLAMLLQPYRQETHGFGDDEHELPPSLVSSDPLPFGLLLPQRTIISYAHGTGTVSTPPPNHRPETPTILQLLSSLVIFFCSFLFRCCCLPQASPCRVRLSKRSDTTSTFFHATAQWATPAIEENSAPSLIQQRQPLTWPRLPIPSSRYTPLETSARAQP